MMTDAEDAEAERRRSRDVFRHRGNGAHVVRVDDVEGYVVPLPGRDGRPGRNSPEATRRRRWQVVDGDAEGVERVRMEEPEEEEREEKAGCCCGLGAVGKRIRLAMGRLGSGWRREEGKKRSRRSWDMAAVKMQ